MKIHLSDVESNEIYSESTLPLFSGKTFLMNHTLIHLFKDADEVIKNDQNK